MASENVELVTKTSFALPQSSFGLIYIETIDYRILFRNVSFYDLLKRYCHTGDWIYISFHLALPPRFTGEIESRMTPSVPSISEHGETSGIRTFPLWSSNRTYGLSWILMDRVISRALCDVRQLFVCVCAHSLKWAETGWLGRNREPV